jgi:hypothetical protein
MRAEKEEQEKKAREEAERQRIEREERLRLEEEERIARRKVTIAGTPFALDKRGKTKVLSIY